MTKSICIILSSKVVSTFACLHEISNKDVIAWLANISSSSARLAFSEEPVELPYSMDFWLTSYTIIARKPISKLELLLLTLDDFNLVFPKVAWKLTQYEHKVSSCHLHRYLLFKVLLRSRCLFLSFWTTQKGLTELVLMVGPEVENMLTNDSYVCLQERPRQILIQNLLVSLTHVFILSSFPDDHWQILSLLLVSVIERSNHKVFNHLEKQLEHRFVDFRRWKHSE
jgi:hypothetical protein